MLESTAVTRMAVEFLTLWMDPNEEATIEHITRVLVNRDQSDEAVGAAVMTTGEAASVALTGQLNLSMLLLLKLAKEQGATSEAEIRAKAGEILQELSLGLPE